MRSEPLGALRLAAISALLLLAACGGPGHVEFAQGQCIIDGRPATLPEVEARQAIISERIVGRQPLFVLVTVLIVLLAGLSHIEKLILLFSTRRAQGNGLGERLKIALDRYRANPIRYFAIVICTLMLLGGAGGFYVYLDADKRASERALGLLQFCHLALRNTEAEGILDEQRQNLLKIESTAGSIRRLVDKLPPEEQRKAKEIVEQINGALAHQGRLVGDYLQRTDESNKAARAQTQTLERGLATLEARFGSLEPVPAALHDLSEQLKAVDSHLNVTLSAADARLAVVKSTLDTLAARPAPACPACNCDSPRAPRDGGAPAR